MRHLNYHHLLYFHTVAEEGSIAKAADILNITPQTISGQLKLLESVFGQPLFVKSGRGLQISDAGRAVKIYTDDIFSTGLRLAEHVKSNQFGATAELRVGIADSIPKLVACQLMTPIVSEHTDVKLVCSEGQLDSLLAELSVHRLDLIISDRPIPAEFPIKAYNHVLGKTPIVFYAPRRWSRRLSKNYPESLNSTPLLMPHRQSPLRRQLDDWLEDHSIEPNVVAEFDDSALMKTFGEASVGVFPSPELIGIDISERYQVKPIGRVDNVFEQYVIISPQRKLRHDLVKELVDKGRQLLLGQIRSSR